MRTTHLKTKVQARVFGTRNGWSLAWQRGFERTGTDCTVQLEIQGDDTSGYHLIQTPEGFFTADSWHRTVKDAQASAEELFGVPAGQWRTTPG